MVRTVVPSRTALSYPVCQQSASIAVFFAEYLRHRAEAGGLEVPRHAQDLVDHIARDGGAEQEPEEPDDPLA